MTLHYFLFVIVEFVSHESLLISCVANFDLTMKVSMSPNCVCLKFYFNHDGF